MKFPARYRYRFSENHKEQPKDIVVEFLSETTGKVIKGGPYYNEGKFFDNWIPCTDKNFWEPLDDPKPTFHQHPAHSRFLKVNLVEDGVEKTMDIEVRYLGESNAENGCILDKIVMPAIKEKLGVVN